MCDSGPWDRVPFAAAAAAPPSPAVPRHHPNTRRRSTLPGVPLGAGVGGGSRPQRHRSLVVLELGSAHRREPTAGPGPRTIAGRRVAQETECDKVRVSHFHRRWLLTLHTLSACPSGPVPHRREREREGPEHPLAHKKRRAPVGTPGVQVRRFTAALLPTHTHTHTHMHTHSKTSRRRRCCLEPSAVVGR